MKRFFLILSIAMMFTLGVNAQDADSTAAAAAPAQTEATAASDEAAAPAAVVEEGSSATFHQVLKQKFIEGGAGFMATVLVCLIMGLAIAIERIIYLNLASTNTEKLLKKLPLTVCYYTLLWAVEEELKKGNVKAAKEIARATRGPVGSIFYQGLERIEAGESIDQVEKSVVSYGGVEMGRLEKNISWLALFIALAPMLGFLGTVVGMVEAFDAIEAAGDIQPSLVAGGIKVALLTTLFGLIVAIILQVFYNYIISLVDDIVNKMEDASISLMDMLVKYKK